MDFSDYDLQTQEQNLERRKAIIDALAGRTLAPTTGDLMKGLFGNSVEDRLATEQANYARDHQAFQGRKQQMLGSELDAFTSRMQGAPARPPVSMTGEEAQGPTYPAQAPNPREAVVRAMTSQLPEMQAMGKAAMSTMGKQEEFTPHVIGNQLVFTSKSGGIKDGGTYNKADWGAVQEVGRDAEGKPLFGQKNAQTGEIKYTPHPLVNIDQKGQTKVQEDALKALSGSREQVIGAQQQLDAAQRVLALVDDPQVQTGFGASAVNGVAALGAKLGFNGPEGVAKTQSLMTDLARNTLAAGQSMKGSFSDKDIQFLSDVTAGKVDYNPMTLKHMASLAYAAGHNTLMNATDQYRGASSIPGIQGAEKVYPLPEVRYDATIGDRPGFSMGQSGRLRYDGNFAPAAKPKVNASGRRVMSLDEFMNGGQ